MSVAFMWADKAILRRIREQIPEVASAACTYFALCEIASDNASEEFEATQQAIAGKLGLSVRTVGDRIGDLERIRAIEVARPLIKSAARFKLLNQIGNGCRSISNDCRTIRNGEADPLPIPVKGKKQEQRRAAPTPSRLTVPDKIALEKTLERLKPEIDRLSRLDFHERTPDLAAELAEKREQYAEARARLDEDARAIA